MHIGIIGILLGMYLKVQADCEPYIILIREEERCLHELRLHNVSKTPQPGKVYRNCTDTGWTDPFPPYEHACFNETLHLLGESHDSHMYFPYVKTMYTAGYALSLISLTIAITILCLFRKLHCTRNYIHIQLFVSFILRASFIFIKDSVLFTDEDFYHCDDYPVVCKLVVMFSNYCIMANYSWLLVEGHYLHTLVSVSFFSKKKPLWWYIIQGWGLPMIVIVSWGLAKYFYEDEGCWETRVHDWVWWILRVPVLLFIVINFIFFLSIIRILVGKLRMPDMHGTEFSQYKRLTKSTFLLVTLFGLYYILFAFLPIKVSGLTYKIWTFVELALASTQGFGVAVLYCFLNGEVQYEVQRRWRRWRLKQHLHGAPRHHGSMSQSGSPLTQVSLLPCSGPASLA
ncbi:vasoactive intestinal polypeptide receptor-like isoform X3 [Coregonus clupeaformis]|uniref:vasoactive intestinal polypeptide receptor-like isoform X3 n=1 Tax=Coregonus clupeaformis TaxID=59861 RepID=UPI001E1C4FC6|nr:vasoactive intestinal polypeptide receptor-like isoform X3 [Coregonus clupeaformis]